MRHDIATELSYAVLEKQRRDPEVVLSPRHQVREVAQSIKTIQRLRDLDAAEPVQDTIRTGRFWKHGRR